MLFWEEWTRLQNLRPLPAATTAWSLHPSSSQPASLCLHPASVFFLSPLNTAALLDLKTRQLGGILTFSLVTFPYPIDNSHSSGSYGQWKEQGNTEIFWVGLPIGLKSYCFRKPCGCLTLLSMTEKSREGEKAIAQKAEAASANRWRRLVELAASFTRQRCLVFLWPIFSCWSEDVSGIWLMNSKWLNAGFAKKPSPCCRKAGLLWSSSWTKTIYSLTA